MVLLLNITRSAIRRTVMKSHLRLWSTAANENLEEWNNVKTQYSDKQLTMFLKKLNKCSVRQLQKYGISERSIEVLQSEKKSLKSLDDLIARNIVTVSELEGVCTTIKKKEDERKVVNKMRPEIVHDIKTVVGLHIGPIHMSWVEVKSSNENSCNISQWSIQHNKELKLKPNFVDYVQTGLKLANDIPDADAYVIEKTSRKPTPGINSTILQTALRESAITSAILTALAAKKNSKKGLSDVTVDSIYIMPQFASAKLFKLFIGNEAVSSENVIQDILSQRKQNKLKNISHVSAEEELNQYYVSKNVYEKASLNRSLLTALTFFELVIFEK